ncbi:MAG TPA: methyltransferase domain-containing protein [Gemmatimonadaceae bacterium]|nr:methyltransferase domain-containing protein [Gemmatimonadaceae bacterium]
MLAPFPKSPPRRMTSPRSSSDVAGAYNRWAASYDADKNATRDLDAVVVRRAALVIDDRDVLELGSGTGKNTEYLAARARSVIAMDFSEAMIARAHQRIPTSNVRFLLHDVRDTWPVQPASVDAVVANLILEHVHDLAPVFFEAARVLRPGGQFFFCELHPYRQLIGAQAHFVDPETGETIQVTAHVHTVSEYLNGAIEAGFTVRSIGEWTEDSAPEGSAPRLISVLLELD